MLDSWRMFFHDFSSHIILILSHVTFFSLAYQPGHIGLMSADLYRGNPFQLTKCGRVRKYEVNGQFGSFDMSGMNPHFLRYSMISFSTFFSISISSKGNFTVGKCF